MLLYIGFMLQELKKVIDFLVVVCNYRSIVRGIENIQPYADKIVYRENRGFDAGAYKEVICCQLGWDEICKYDELIFVNDSFYGPFYALQDLFTKMERIDIDYWGLTKSPKGKLAGEWVYSSHVQSYFFAVRKKILLNQSFRSFWEDMIFPSTISQATIIFELEINEVLRKSGFLGTTLMDLYPNYLNVKEDENPYLVCPFELIRDVRIPILKRKSLSIRNRSFDNVLEALRFIQYECDYETDLITNHLSRIGKGNHVIGLDKFYNTHKKMFIYGAGLCGKNLAKYFEFKNWTFEKFLVTKSVKELENCIVFDEASISANDGIIIAVSDELVFRDILKLVEKRCGKNQIYNYNGTIQ